jgi:hypothetical protein
MGGTLADDHSERRKQMKHEAMGVLSAAGIAVDQDFDSLSPDHLAAVRREAESAYQRKHGEPMPSGRRQTSYMRKRYDLLQQRARLKR